jgi:hypothetical protein
MSSTTPIEWTDSTWNPLHGCTEVSPGCANCYAKTFSERFRGVVGHHFQHGFDLRLIPHRLNDPLFLKRPRKIFVNSMSDLFHEKVPEDYIEKVCRTMLTANWHTYQVLTKRHVRMSSLLKTTLKEAAAAPHIWWGGQRGKSSTWIAAYRRTAAEWGSRKIPFRRAPVGGLGRDKFVWNRLGHSRRRKRSSSPANDGGLGCWNPRPMSGSPRAFLFQAVGRNTQEKGWKTSRRPCLRRVS